MAAVEARRIVADGYDAVAERYFEWSDARPSAVRRRWLGRALELIPSGSDVLDLGCGAGVPMTKALAESRRVTGVDLSPRQIELARLAVPEATFAQADMTRLALPPASVDAVTAFYSLTHIPRDEMPDLLASIQRWLRPGGLLLASMGAYDSPDSVDPDWLGAPMFFSHHGVKRSRAIVREAGFELEEAVVEQEPEDRHDATFLWVVARKARPVPNDGDQARA